MAEAIQILRSRLSGSADLLTLPVREISSEYAARGATWICRAVNDSMIGSGILSGDRTLRHRKWSPAARVTSEKSRGRARG